MALCALPCCEGVHVGRVLFSHLIDDLAGVSVQAVLWRQKLSQTELFDKTVGYRLLLGCVQEQQGVWDAAEGTHERVVAWSTFVVVSHFPPEHYFLHKGFLDGNIEVGEVLPVVPEVFDENTLEIDGDDGFGWICWLVVDMRTVIVEDYTLLRPLMCDELDQG